MSTTALTVSSPIAKSHGGLIAGKLNVQFGRVELLTDELRVHTISRAYQMFGVIGLLLGRRAKGKLALTVALPRVRAIARGKYGFNKKVLDVTVEDGTTHRIMVDDFDRFTAALRTRLPPTAAVASLA